MLIKKAAKRQRRGKIVYDSTAHDGDGSRERLE